MSNPTLPTRWSQPVPVARIEAAARTSAASVVSLDEAATPARRDQAARRERPAGRARRRHARHQGRGAALHPRPPEGRAACARGWSISRPAASIRPPTSRRSRSRCIIRAARPACSPATAAPRSPRMAEAFETWIARQSGIAGIISAGGSGGTALVDAGDAAPAGRRAEDHDLDRRLRRRRPLRRPGRHHDDVFGHRRAGPQLDLAPDPRERRAGDGRHGEGAARRGARGARRAARRGRSCRRSGSPCSASPRRACSSSPRR